MNISTVLSSDSASDFSMTELEQPKSDTANLFCSSCQKLLATIAVAGHFEWHIERNEDVKIVSVKTHKAEYLKKTAEIRVLRDKLTKQLQTEREALQNIVSKIYDKRANKLRKLFEDCQEQNFQINDQTLTKINKFLQKTTVKAAQRYASYQKYLRNDEELSQLRNQFKEFFDKKINGAEFPQVHFFIEETTKLRIFRSAYAFEMIPPLRLEWIDVGVRIPMWHYSVTVQNGDIYMIGGSDNGTFIDKIYRYRHSSKSMKEVSKLNIARRQVAACVINRRIYVVSGESNSGYHDICEYFDAIQQDDIKISHAIKFASLPAPTAQCRITALGTERILKSGGKGILSNLMALYEIKTNTWQTIPIQGPPLTKNDLICHLFFPLSENQILIAGGWLDIPGNSYTRKLELVVQIDINKGFAKKKWSRENYLFGFFRKTQPVWINEDALIIPKEIGNYGKEPEIEIYKRSWWK